MKTPVVAERQERIKVQETTTQLAQGVGQLTKEIRENRPINANVLFDRFLRNRVTTTFTAVRPGLFGPATKESVAQTILVTDGAKVCALMHISDTPFSLTENGYDWDKLAIEFSARPVRTAARRSCSFSRWIHAWWSSRSTRRR